MSHNGLNTDNVFLVGEANEVSLYEKGETNTAFYIILNIVTLTEIVSKGNIF